MPPSMGATQFIFSFNLNKMKNLIATVALAIFPELKGSTWLEVAWEG